MVKPTVKPTVKPSGKPPSRREEGALRTRAAILDAARLRFGRDGYGSTTIADLADEAGVAVQTVYAVFGNKRTVLAELLDRSIAGDDEPVAVNDRPWMRAVWDAPTAADRLRAYAAAVERIMAGAGDVFRIVSTAATTDPQIRALAATTEQRRRTGAAAVVDSVRTVGRLRPGLTRRRAIDLLWMLNGPDIHHHLVGRAGWSPARYRTWLGEAMVRELLDPAGDAPARPGV
jgi:AcrR family transcriptional regulator